MGYHIIPSGSIDPNTLGIPSWSRPTIEMWGLKEGCLARVLPAGGSLSGELVLIMSQSDHSQAIDKESQVQSFNVFGQKGHAVLPYYALSVESYPPEYK